MNLIAAADANWGIGKDGGLLVHLPGDLRYFKEKTSGKAVIMGARDTGESAGRQTAAEPDEYRSDFADRLCKRRLHCRA